MKGGSIIKPAVVTLFLVIVSFACQAQNAVAVGCYTSSGKPKPCGSGPWTEYKDGVAYDVWCDCSKSPPYVIKRQSTSSPTTVNNDRPAVETTSNNDLEIQQQANEREKAELEKLQAFERGKLELSGGLKRNTSTTTPVLKTGTTSLPLKSGNSLPVDLKTAVPPTKEKEAEKIIPSDKNEDRKKSIELIELAREVQDEAIKLNLEAENKIIKN